MITVKNLNDSIAEAERFIKRAKAARMAVESERTSCFIESMKWTKKEFDERWTPVGGPETSACRRSSMDLTRSLARLRSRK